MERARNLSRQIYAPDLSPAIQSANLRSSGISRTGQIHGLQRMIWKGLVARCRKCGMRMVACVLFRYLRAYLLVHLQELLQGLLRQRTVLDPFPGILLAIGLSSGVLYTDLHHGSSSMGWTGLDVLCSPSSMRIWPCVPHPLSIPVPRQNRLTKLLLPLRWEIGSNVVGRSGEDQLHADRVSNAKWRTSGIPSVAVSKSSNTVYRLLYTDYCIILCTDTNQP